MTEHQERLTLSPQPLPVTVIGAPTRFLLLVTYGTLALPILTLLSLGVPGMAWLWPVDTFVRSIPLVAAIWIDGAFYDGGELGPAFLPVWVAFTACLLWPLLLLGIRPTLWRSQFWQKITLGYSGGAMVLTVAAARWIFTHTSYLF